MLHRLGIACTAVLLLLAAAPALAQDCDCARPLPLAGPPACGANGITYQTRCLATCQGIAIAAPGPCGAASEASEASPRSALYSAGGPAAAATPAHPLAAQVDSDGEVDAAALSRYSSEGFTFAARVKLQSRRDDAGAAAAADADAPPRVPSAARRLLGSPSAARATTVRLTPDGSLYMKEQPAQALGAAAAGLHPGSRPAVPAPAARRAARRAAARKLLVLGADDRQEVPMAREHDYPFSAVGHLDGTGCTGTLIARSTVLTAGHCVFNRGKQAWYRDLDFMPNLVAGGPHCHTGGGPCTREQPVAWAHADTLFVHASSDDLCDDGRHGCSRPTDSVYDVALIRLAEPAGDAYGWMGYGYQCAEQGYRVTTAGYPGDLPDHHMFWTTGTLPPFSACPAEPWGVEGNVVPSADLDSAGGQSGSAVWDGDGTIRAIIVTGNDQHTNVRAVTAGSFEWIKGLAA